MIVGDVIRKGRDAEGRNIIGNPGKGCRHCGEVAMKYSRDGKTVLHHPGVECCERSVQDQIRYRQGEKVELEKKIIALLNEKDRLEREAESFGRSQSTQAIEARKRAEAARVGIDRQIAAARGIFREVYRGQEVVLSDEQIDDLNLVGIRQLENEITRLSKKLGYFRKAKV